MEIKINIWLFSCPPKQITFMQPEHHFNAKASFNLQNVWKQMRKREKCEDVELP